MTATEIIYDYMRQVRNNTERHIVLSGDDLYRMAGYAVRDIREEFKKAGIDPWKEVKDEDPEEALHDQSEHPEG